MAIHVFILDAAPLVKFKPYLFSLLNTDQKAFCYSKTQKRKAQYLFSRLLLRYGLSCCVNQSVDAVDVIELESSKPESVFAQKNNLHFGLSHSGSLYSVAVSCGANHHNVGVDIECLRPIRNEKSVEFFCSKKQEDTFYRLADGDEKSYYYYQLWTQKEALLKATGGSVFSDRLKSCHFLEIGSQLDKETGFFVKTSLLDEECLFSELAYLSVCSEKLFELQVSRVFLDEHTLDVRHKSLQVDSKSFLSAFDQ